MDKLTPAEFFTRAIERVPVNPTYPKYRHLGVRLNVLRKPFAKYYGTEMDFAQTVDSLIKQKVVVAVHLKWGEKTAGRKPVEVERFECYPDPLIQDDDNPILYLPLGIPKVLTARVDRADEVLDKILKPTLVAANG